MMKDLYAFSQLTVRNLKIFLKDKLTVFFSLLAPLIILMLYVLFLGDVQFTSMKGSIPEQAGVSDKLIRVFIDSWMLAGVISVACLTVSFSANTIMVQDRSRGVINDALSSPIRPITIKLSYFLSNFLITLIICCVLLAISFVYLAIRGWYLSVGDVFGILGNTLLSILSAAFFTVFVCGFFKSESALGGAIGIISAAIGFLIGAYMPISMFPKAIQYIIAFIPGTYSAGIYRNLFMHGALDAMGLPTAAADGIAKSYSFNIDFFGRDVKPPIMAVILALSVVLFLGMNVVNIVLTERKRKMKR